MMLYYIFLLLETIDHNIGWCCFIRNLHKIASSGLIINWFFPLLQQLLILSILRIFKVCLLNSKILSLEYVRFFNLNTVADQCRDLIVLSHSQFRIKNEAKCRGKFLFFILGVKNASLTITFLAAHL